MYIRKLNRMNPGAGRYLSISIPAELSDIFKTDEAIVQALPDREGIIIIPAEVRPLFISENGNHDN